MTKILKSNETGFGLLIEHEGFVKPINNNKTINEDFQFDLNKPILVDCVLQKWGVKNKNGRIYPKEVLIPQVNEYQKLIDNDSAVSEADHPDSSIISLNNISHMLTKMWWGKGEDENVLYGQLKLIVSPGYIKNGVVSVIGDKILLYLQNGIKLGISSRGVGSLQEVNGENIVQDDFELIGFDLVVTPSTPGAYLTPIASKETSFNENYGKKNSIYLKENNKINAIDNFLNDF